MATMKTQFQTSTPLTTGLNNQETNNRKTKRILCGSSDLLCLQSESVQKLPSMQKTSLPAFTDSKSVFVCVCSWINWFDCHNLYLSNPDGDSRRTEAQTASVIHFLCWARSLIIPLSWSSSLTCGGSAPPQPSDGSA